MQVLNTMCNRAKFHTNQTSDVCWNFLYGVSKNEVKVKRKKDILKK